MSYIIKKTSGLLNTRLTDIGRQRISQGNFNVKYFQIGDSEVCYDCVDNLNPKELIMVEPPFAAKGIGNSQYIKYPFKQSTKNENFFGIGRFDSIVSPIYNKAAPRGFFIGEDGSWSANTSWGYSIVPIINIEMSDLTGNTNFISFGDFCEPPTPPLTEDCCSEIPIPDPLPDPVIVSGICDGPQPEPLCETLSEFGGYLLATIFFDCCGGCDGNLRDGYTMLTYKVCCVDGTLIQFDRDLPNFVDMGFSGLARVLIYPSENMNFYGTYTPYEITNNDLINFSSVCGDSEYVPKIWNMNIPWSENIAGVFSSTTNDFQTYHSKTYLGSKEYFGYQTNGSQFFSNSDEDNLSTDTFYLNSYDEKIYVEPNDQKTIGLIHYSNNLLDNIYGEKFATLPIDQTDVGSIGQAMNFRLDIPWLMWHKRTDGKMGQSFYIDPPGYNNLNVSYMLSSVDSDMNNPGLRYFHLWDTNENENGELNRIGKVFPDNKMVIIDDEEIVAAMSYKSNRNWTLPAPKLTLVEPNVCTGDDSEGGLLENSDEYLWVTYRFNNTAFTQSLHCNYYSVIQGPKSGCTTNTQNVSVRFGEEFPFLNQPTNSCTFGYFASGMSLLVQKVSGTTRPLSENWLEIDVTDYLTGSTINGYITQSGITNTVFTIDGDSYSGGTVYNLNNYIDLPPTGDTLNCLNFGDEYYFYGNIETDIEATIYEMRYGVNLDEQNFTISSNPTWDNEKKPYISEIGLYDENKDLMFLTKLQSPQLRGGQQQFLIKLDF